MLTKEFLEKRYIDEAKTAKEIAVEINLSDTQVRYWLKKFNIPIKPRGGGYKTVDLKNKEFGDYTVLEQVKGDGQQAIWKCRCKCGKVKNIRANNLKQGHVKSCGKCKNHYAWKGYGCISGQYWSILKNNAKRRKIKFDITIEYAWDLYIKQNNKCKISGVDIFFTKNYTGENKSQTASLDRIDSKKGYIEGNIQWVHKIVNIIKWNLSMDEFLNWNKLIVENNK